MLSMHAAVQLSETNIRLCPHHSIFGILHTYRIYTVRFDSKTVIYDTIICSYYRQQTMSHTLTRKLLPLQIESQYPTLITLSCACTQWDKTIMSIHLIITVSH